MRLLDRYLLRELLLPLGYCLCGFLILMVFGDLFAELGEFQKKKLSAGDLLAYPGLLPASGLANAREGRTWLAGDYNRKTSQMRNPQVIWTLPDGSQRWLFASRAVRTNGVWTFYNVSECKASATNALLAPS